MIYTTPENRAALEKATGIRVHRCGGGWGICVGYGDFVPIDEDEALWVIRGAIATWLDERGCGVSPSVGGDGTFTVGPHDHEVFAFSMVGEGMKTRDEANMAAVHALLKEEAK